MPAPAPAPSPPAAVPLTGPAPAPFASWQGRRGEGLILLAILALALGLRLWDLPAGGWGAEYYSAAVLSMSQSWHNFFYCAFDPAGFISVDKPPLALWLQVAGVGLLGFNSWGLFLPQALAGVAAVGVLYGLTRRRLGAMAALLAAFLLAVTPVWVAVNRTNNTDSCLVLVLLLSAGALLRAAEEGSRRRLCLAMALLGLAFNAKMLAALVVLPVFGLVYWLGAPQTWRRRLLDLTLAGAVLLATCLPWVLAVELTPPQARPHVGGSPHNSMLELVVGHNALGRFVSRMKAPVPGQTADPAPTADSARPAAQAWPGAGPAPEARSVLAQALARVFVRQPPGPLRLGQGQLAAQVAWLAPLALLALVLGGWRRPLPPVGLTPWFWAGWVLLYGLVYSYLGGIIHFYYLATLAPALAALAGMGLTRLWDLYRRGGWPAAWLPASLLVTAAWQFHIQAGALGGGWAGLLQAASPWLTWPHLTLAAGSLAGALGLGLALLPRAPGRPAGWLARGALALGLLPLLALPMAWSLSSVLVPGHGLLPSADLERLLAASRPGGQALLARLRQANDTSRLVEFLRAHHGGERFLLATSTSQVAAPVIIATGQPVMAMGGFHGLDPAIDTQGLERLVKEGQVRFVLLGDVNLVSRRMGAEALRQPIAGWVRAHGRPVDPALWRSSPLAARQELHDLGGLR
ncbi:MAG: glycosyltransferase family 39 protein [Desulfarculus sp.]|nr:glycosyltransferase family 39 protein [Desulfarculus sp.]